jgi:ankyrin repeat protein
MIHSRNLVRLKAILFLTILISSGCSLSTEDQKSVMVTNEANDTWTSNALEKGDAEAVRKRVLDDPGFLLDRDYVGNTPLLTAVEFDNLELVTFLLQRGADPNVTVDDGYTCLLTAIESDEKVSIKIVATLITAGADIHFAGINGWTPLHMAAARGHAEKVKLLIAAGADLNQRKDIDAHETPLLEAAFMGQPETVKLLLDSGANASLRDVINNRTPLETAKYVAAGPDPEVYKLLKKENMQIDTEDIFDDMDLPSDLLEMLREEVGKVDMAESYFQNSTEIAESGNHAEVIRILTGHKSSK